MNDKEWVRLTCLYWLFPYNFQHMVRKNLYNADDTTLMQR